MKGVNITMNRLNEMRSYLDMNDEKSLFIFNLLGKSDFLAGK